MDINKIYRIKHKILISIVIVIASFGLFGWLTGKLFFAQLSVLYIPMAPSTVLSFLIVAVIFFFLLKKPEHKTIYIVSQFFLMAIIIFSAVVIFEWINNPVWDIENIFIKNPDSFQQVVTGRMSPLTALLFILESLSVLFYSLKTRSISKALLGLLILSAFFISSVLLIGYLFKTPLLYGGNIIPVALPTAICFWLMSIGLLMVIQLGFWPFSALRSNAIGNKLAKTFLPVIVFLLILNSYLQSSVMINLQNPALVSAISLIIALPVIGFIIISISKSLGKSLEKAQQETLEAEHRFSKAITHAPFPIMIHSDGKVIQLSNSWTEITGYTINDIPTIAEWTMKAYGEDAAPSQEFINKLYEIDEVQFDGRWEIKIRDGSKRIWVFMTSPIGTMPDGKKVVSSMAVDVTEQIKTEISLKEKNEEIEAQNEEYRQINEELFYAKTKAEDSDRLKTEFINNMSHEIRTPMNGIIGFTRFLNKEDLSKEKRNHYVNIIQNSGYRLMKIIDDIIEISILGTKQIEAVEKEICLNDLLIDLFSIFDIKAKASNLPLYLKKGLSDYDSRILTDETKLNKIISNLLENAFKFTYEGYIEFGYEQRNNELQIYVKDTGVGIKNDKHEKIFERFSQEDKEMSRNIGGLGLGLSIAKENAELLGGKISLQSEKGKGTTFFVTLPYKPVNSKLQNTSLEDEKGEMQDKPSKYVILIVEDDEVNYLYLETLLEDIYNSEFKILHAKNGKEAVEMCKNGAGITIVLMDLKMSVMDGFEATKLIKEIRPHLPIIAQTAYSTIDDHEKAISFGCDDFITKPIEEKLLVELLNKYLRR